MKPRKNMRFQTSIYQDIAVVSRYLHMNVYATEREKGLKLESARISLEFIENSQNIFLKIVHSYRSAD